MGARGGMEHGRDGSVGQHGAVLVINGSLSSLKAPEAETTSELKRRG